MDKIINNLPSTYKKDSWVQAIMQAAQLELDKLEIDAIQLGNELMLNFTSEKQLKVEEMLCGFEVSEKESIQSRKANVSAKWKVKSIITLDTLQAVVDSWEDGNVELSYPDADSVHLTFVEPSGVPEDLQGMYKSLREVAPAHIPFTAERVYNHPKSNICIAAVPTLSARILIKPKPKDGEQSD